MIKLQLTIINKLGLHARASAKLVAEAMKFSSEFKIIKDSHSINGKSIMAVLMLAATKGSKLSLEFNGVDEKEMAAAIKELIKNKFGEAE